jgi:uncharacterized protein
MKSCVLLLLMAAVAVTGCATPDDKAGNKVIIQVSSADPKIHKLAINNVENARKHFGADKVKIEVVAFGPGLKLLTKDSAEKSRIERLALMDEVSFNACLVTLGKFEKKLGKKPELIDQVKMVPGGVPYIMALQKEGYAYIRP